MVCLDEVAEVAVRKKAKEAKEIDMAIAAETLNSKPFTYNFRSSFTRVLNPQRCYDDC